MQLIDCFQSDFIQWLNKSNNPKLDYYRSLDFKLERIPILYISRKLYMERLVEESLNEILNILLKEPEADYFWYTYPENGGELTYSLPHHDVVPGDAIRIDKDKLKIFLRDYKLEQIL